MAYNDVKGKVVFHLLILISLVWGSRIWISRENVVTLKNMMQFFNGQLLLLHIIQDESNPVDCLLFSSTFKAKGVLLVFDPPGTLPSSSKEKGAFPAE